MSEVLVLRTASAGLRPDPARFHRRIERIRRFLADHADRFVIERDLDELLAAGRSDGLVYIERARDGALVAASGAFPKNGDDLHGPVYLELGATLVRPDYRGFGLHPVLQQVRLLRLYLLYRHALVVFTCVKTDNERSAGSLLKNGFVETDDPAILAMKPSTEGRRFFRFPLAGLPQVARSFLGRRGVHVHRSIRYPDRCDRVDDRQLEVLLEPEIRQRRHLLIAIEEIARGEL